MPLYDLPTLDSQGSQVGSLLDVSPRLLNLATKSPEFNRILRLQLSMISRKGALVMSLLVKERGGLTDIFKVLFLKLL